MTDSPTKDGKRKRRPLVDVKCLELAEHFLDFDSLKSIPAEQIEDAKWDMAEQFQSIGEEAAIALEEQAEKQA
jgi:hypothetical protein